MDRTDQDEQSMDIVARFGQWVKQLHQQVAELRDEPALRTIEQQVRSEGQALLGQLLQTLLQQAVARQEPATRACPHCGIRRRHKGLFSLRVQRHIFEHPLTQPDGRHVRGG
ncbi:MAG: hypothetical protein ACLFV3_03535 [Phycisphaeraceae bacterium]